MTTSKLVPLPLPKSPMLDLRGRVRQVLIDLLTHRAGDGIDA